MLKLCKTTLIWTKIDINSVEKEEQHPQYELKV